MDSSTTHVSLLLRLRKNESNETAWIEFINRYGGRIYQWCLQRNLQPADAEDVTQNVLMKIAKALQTFEYDASLTFRGWLRTITENAVRDFFRQCERKATVKGGSSILVAIDTSEAPLELVERLNEAFDLEIFEQALENVQSRISQHRWLAWDLTAREQMKPIEVAAKLKMKIANVYTAKNQVQAMIADEISALEEHTPPTE